MKKMMIATAFALGAGVSASAIAGPTATWSSGNHTVSTASCTLLARSVELGASNNVSGGYLCDETLNVIKVAACHAGGGRNTGVTCAYVDDDNDPSTPAVLNSAGCTADTIGQASTIPNYKAFSASSAGGALAERELTGRCATGSLSAITFWNAQ